MRSYYPEVLSAERLRACYEVAPKRTQQYLDAEISYVFEKISQEMTVLELGCRYDRVLKKLSKYVAGCFVHFQMPAQAKAFSGVMVREPTTLS